MKPQHNRIKAIAKVVANGKEYACYTASDINHYQLRFIDDKVQYRVEGLLN